MFNWRKLIVFIDIPTTQFCVVFFYLNFAFLTQFLFNYLHCS
jgi:hypothetical protein